MCLSLPCTLSCRSTSTRQTSASCRSSLRCRTPCAACTTLPRVCVQLPCTTHNKRPLPHLQVARQTSLLNESFGSTQAARIADWIPSLVYVLSRDQFKSNHWVCLQTWCSCTQKLCIQTSLCQQSSVINDSSPCFCSHRPHILALLLHHDVTAFVQVYIAFLVIKGG